MRRINSFISPHPTPHSLPQHPHTSSETSICHLKSLRRSRGAVTALVGLASASAGLLASAEMFRPAPTPGGLQVAPVIESVTPTGSNATLKFHGLQAPYKILVSSDLAFSNPGEAGLTRLTHPNHTGTALATNLPAGTAYFRLVMLGATNWVGQWNSGALSASNVWVGSASCNGCHGVRVSEWAGTGHALAVNAILNSNGSFKPGSDETCLACHTVGRNQPGGFQDMTTTPQLAGVGCENCHGSASAHVNISGRIYHPANTAASEVCGGCHENHLGTTYSEWTSSGHGAVSEHVAAALVDTPSGRDSMMRCGPCHSAAMRLTLLHDVESRAIGQTNYLAMPAAADAAGFGITCAVCHDPHKNPNPHQLRNPLFSTNFFSLSASTTLTNIPLMGTYYLGTSFASQYSANIQICAQCHNQRGAKWTDTSRPPHHSPQYNVLIGDIGLADLAPMVGAHALRVTNQCAQCHVYSHRPDPASPPGMSNVVDSGHSFEVTLHGCSITGCHSSSNSAANLIFQTQAATRQAVAEVVGLLNTWATTKAPTGLQAYGQYAWEYATAGQLSNPAGTNSISGPITADQALIPSAIRKARFYLYLVEHDASQGVHNGDFTRALLQAAKTNVLAELNK